jgi:L-fuculose-phosphate aldolase
MSKSIYPVKQEVVEICRRIYNRGYVAANDGNVSARIDNDHIVMTPTGVSKGFLKLQDLAVVDIDGRQVSGYNKPSSEAKMHLTIYRARADVNAVVHAHPPTATGFAVAGLPLTQCVLPEVIISVGSIPIAEYATPGSQELADVVVKYLSQYDAILMENHGAITVGSTVTNAHFKMETIEHFARIMLVAYQLGNVRGLPGQDVQALLAMREKLGIRSSAPVCDVSGTCNSPVKPQAPLTSQGTETQLIEEITRQVMNTIKKP